MPKAKFEKDFDYIPSEYGGRVTLAYKAGKEYPVKAECLEAAKNAGVLVNSSKAEEPKDDG